MFMMLVRVRDEIAVFIESQRIGVGEDLDVLLELADRIVVLCGGQVAGIADARTATKEEIGLMMTQFTAKEDGR